MWDHNLNYQENHERVEALCSLVEHEEWQDISTAPVDGTEILLKSVSSRWDNQEEWNVDMGRWGDYTQTWWYKMGQNDLDGEWNTDLGMGEPKYWKHKP